MGNQADAGVRGKLVEIFSMMLKRPIGADENVMRADENAWDSLRHVELVFVVEDAFDIAFAPEDIEKLVSLDAFAAVIAAKGGAAA